MKKIVIIQSIIGLMMSMAYSQTSLAMEQTFYKWESKDGSTHYTLTPPPKGAKSLGKMQTYRDFSPSPQRLMPPQNAEQINVPTEQQGESNSTELHNTNNANTLPALAPMPQAQMIRPVFQQGVPLSQQPVTIKQNGREYIPLPR